MNKLKANNFSKALNELNELDKVQAGKLNEEINHGDRKHYHVACVTVIDQPGQAKNKIVITVSKMHPNGFEKLKKNFRHLGYNRIVILHDPSLLDEKETPVVPLHQKESIEAKVRREMEEKHKAEIDQKVKEGIDEAMKKKEEELSETTQDTTEGSQGEGGEGSESGQVIDEVFTELIASGLKDDFIKYAEDNEIDLSTATNNDERKALLIEWHKEQSTQE